jgi:hypothetical protein
VYSSEGGCGLEEVGYSSAGGWLVYSSAGGRGLGRGWFGRGGVF